MKADAARWQEIFVDLVAHTATVAGSASRHVLDARFDTHLPPGERAFKRAMLQLMLSDDPTDGGLPAAAKDTQAYALLLEHLCDKAGLDALGSGRERRRRHVQELKAARETLAARCRPPSPPPSPLPPDPPLSRPGAAAPSEQTDGHARAATDACVGGATAAAAVAAPPPPRPPSQPQQGPAPGHVFVTSSSVCGLYCDAFLCPAAIGQHNPRRKRPSGFHGNVWGQWRRQAAAPLLATLGLGEQGAVKRYDSESDGGCAGGASATGPAGAGPVVGRDRVATLARWPWQEFQCAPPSAVPFVVAGEVSAEKQRLGERPRPLRTSARVDGGVCDVPSQAQSIGALMETVRQFVDVALAELLQHQPAPLARRQRYLLALPVIGTGGGAAGDLTGAIVEQMLRLLAELVAAPDRRCDFDAVLVCADSGTFSLSQAIRSKMLQEADAAAATDGMAGAGAQEAGGAAVVAAAAPMCPCFGLLPAEMRSAADQLARLSGSGQLSLFIGAGVSMGAGLPGWFDLLLGIEDAFTATGAPSERALGDRHGWDPLKMADELAVTAETSPDRHGVRRSLKERIAAVVGTRQHPSLLMALLASLPSPSVVTLNYDSLIERAFASKHLAGGERERETLSVIPTCPVRGARRWLLKMHGCASRPEDIVITSEDFRNFEASRMKALAGLVQANLMTSHMLFVGFSLTDPNYQRIVGEVRRALDPAAVGSTPDDGSGDGSGGGIGGGSGGGSGSGGSGSSGGEDLGQ
jgi:uncharacterized membrane protein YgcG